MTVKELLGVRQELWRAGDEATGEDDWQWYEVWKGRTKKELLTGQ
jgi:hypothetical protein